MFDKFVMIKSLASQIKQIASYNISLNHIVKFMYLDENRDRQIALL